MSTGVLHAACWCLVDDRSRIQFLLEVPSDRDFSGLRVLCRYKADLLLLSNRLPVPNSCMRTRHPKPSKSAAGWKNAHPATLLQVVDAVPQLGHLDGRHLPLPQYACLEPRLKPSAQGLFTELIFCWDSLRDGLELNQSH